MAGSLLQRKGSRVGGLNKGTKTDVVFSLLQKKTTPYYSKPTGPLLKSEIKVSANCAEQ